MKGKSEEEMADEEELNKSDFFQLLKSFKDLRCLKHYNEFIPVDPAELVRDYETSPNEWYHLTVEPVFLEFIFFEPRIKIYSMCLSHTIKNNAEPESESETSEFFKAYSVKFKHLNMNKRLQALVHFEKGLTKSHFIEEHSGIIRSLGRPPVLAKEPNFFRIRCLDHAVSVLTHICCTTSQRGQREHYAPKVFQREWIFNRGSSDYDRVRDNISKRASLGSRRDFEGVDYDSRIELHRRDSCTCERSNGVFGVLRECWMEKGTQTAVYSPKRKRGRTGEKRRKAGEEMVDEEELNKSDFFQLTNSNKNLSCLNYYNEFAALDPAELVRDYETSPNEWYHLTVEPVYLKLIFFEPRIKIYSMCLSHTIKNKAETESEFDSESEPSESFKTFSAEFKHVNTNKRLQAVVHFEKGLIKSDFNKEPRSVMIKSLENPPFLVKEPNCIKISCLDHAVSVLTSICCTTGQGGRREHYSPKVFRKEWIFNWSTSDNRRVRNIISKRASTGSRRDFGGVNYDSRYALHRRDLCTCKRSKRRIEEGTKGAVSSPKRKRERTGGEGEGIKKYLKVIH